MHRRCTASCCLLSALSGELFFSSGADAIAVHGTASADDDNSFSRVQRASGPLPSQGKRA